MVNPVNEAGDTMTFHLASCKAGPHSIGWVYQLAPGVRGGFTDMRQMALTVNSVAAGTVDFPVRFEVCLQAENRPKEYLKTGFKMTGNRRVDRR